MSGALPQRDGAPSSPGGAGAASAGASALRVFGRLLRSALAPHRAALIGIGAALLVEAAFWGALPMSFKWLADGAIARRDTGALGVGLALLAAFALFNAGVGLARDYACARLIARLLTHWRSRAFAAVLALDEAYFERTPVGDTAARFSTDLAAMEAALAAAIPWALLPALEVLISTVGLFYLCPPLAALAMLVWPLCLGGPRWLMPKASAAALARKRAEGGMLNALHEQLAARRVTRVFGLEAPSTAVFGARLGELESALGRAGFLGALVERSGILGVQGLHVAVLGAGAGAVLAGAMSLGAFAAFMTYFLSLSYSLSYLTQYLPTLLTAGSGAWRLSELFDAADEARGASASEAVAREDEGPSLAGRVPEARPSEWRFEGVSVRHGGGALALDGLDLSWPAGSTLAVVGPSGSGKSTLLAVLARLVALEEGRVSLGGSDLADWPLAVYRRRLGVVFQESVLFDLSVGENIRLGAPQATAAEVEAAARAAGLSSAEWPLGFETPCGERGEKLSGGQRARVALARALVRSPELLLLDEPTAALDAASEALVEASLARLRGRCSIVWVTHRLAQAARADVVLVLENGRVVGFGSHAALREGCSAYRRLWEAGEPPQPASGHLLPPRGEGA